MENSKHKTLCLVTYPDDSDWTLKHEFYWLWDYTIKSRDQVEKHNLTLIRVAARTRDPTKMKS